MSTTLTHDAAIESARTGLAHSEQARQESLIHAAAQSGKGRGHRGGPPHGVAGGAKIAVGPVLRRLLAYARPVLPMMITGLIFAIGGVILTVIMPDFLAKITDEIQAGFMTGINFDRVRSLTLTAGILIAISFLCSAIEGVLMARSTAWVSRSLRSDLDKTIDTLPLSYFDTNTTGNTLSRVTNDVDTLQQTLSNSIASMATGLVTLVGAAVMMFVTSWQLALAAILSSLLGIVGSGLIMARSQKYFVAQQQNLGALNGHIEESLNGHTVIRAFNAQGTVNTEFSERNEALYASAWKAQFLSGLMFPLMNFIGNLGYVVVCVVGAMLVVGGDITIGVVVAFIMYVRIFTNPLGQIAQASTSFQSAAAAGTRVFELMDETRMKDETDVAPLAQQVVRGEVEFRNVAFGYEPGKEIIHDFSAHVPAGSKVAIVGPTGAGKTTLVNLLMRFYEVNSGSILIDGIDIASIPREDVERQFAMVLQDTWLFEGTVRENLAYAHPDVSQAEIERVVELVGLDELISQLPNGYDSVLSDSSAISAGQKQLLTIARAMLADRPLLILDEATSSVDTRTELLIQQALGELASGRTSFVIAHRLSTIKDADIIFVMKDGDIVETGTHTELLHAGGFYADLYNSQFES